MKNNKFCVLNVYKKVVRLLILLQLPPTDIKNIRRINRSWLKAASDPTIWHLVAKSLQLSFSISDPIMSMRQIIRSYPLIKVLEIKTNHALKNMKLLEMDRKFNEYFVEYSEKLAAFAILNGSHLYTIDLATLQIVNKGYLDYSADEESLYTFCFTNNLLKKIPYIKLPGTDLRCHTQYKNYTVTFSDQQLFINNDRATITTIPLENTSNDRQFLPKHVAMNDCYVFFARCAIDNNPNSQQQIYIDIYEIITGQLKTSIKSGMADITKLFIEDNHLVAFENKFDHQKNHWSTFIYVWDTNTILNKPNPIIENISMQGMFAQVIGEYLIYLPRQSNQPTTQINIWNMQKNALTNLFFIACNPAKLMPIAFIANRFYYTVDKMLNFCETTADLQINNIN